MSEALWCVQQITECPSEEEAVRLLTTMKTMDDYLGGRIIRPLGKQWWNLGEPEKVWRVQTLFEDCGSENALPEGLRRVLVLPSMFYSFGMVSQPTSPGCPDQGVST